MKLPKKSPKNKDDFIALDLGYSSAKALYFTKHGEHLSVKGVSIKSVEEQELEKEIIQNVLSECKIQASSDTDKLILGLSGPKVIGFVLIAQLKREVPDHEVTEKEVVLMHDKISSSAYQQVKNRWSVLFADDVDFEPLDLVITSTTIDGEKVDDPIGRTGETIQVSVFCSYAEKKYYENIMTKLKKMKCKVSAVTTALYSQSKLLNEKHKNYIMIDIGKKHTDIGVVLGENIVQTRSFEMGGDFFSKWLASSTGLDFQNANGKKEAYSAKTLSDDETDKISDVIYEAGIMWRTAVKTALLSMSGIKSFPETIYFTGGCTNLPVIQELMFEDSWKQAIPFAGEVETVIPSSELWNESVTDELQVLEGPQMFVPVSIGMVQLEIE